MSTYREKPRGEYPRPDFERKLWKSLNGQWQFGFDDEEVGEVEEWFIDREFAQLIEVPFCYQSIKSGIHDESYHPCLWYKKTFDLQSQESYRGKEIILHFGAVDYITKVWVNGKLAGGNRGGYNHFKMNITPHMKEGQNIIVVKVVDRQDCRQPRGKQSWVNSPDRCWYTASSGIWQSVWLEVVDKVHMEKVQFTPDIDTSTIGYQITISNHNKPVRLEMDIVYKGQKQLVYSTLILGGVNKGTLNLKEIDFVDEVHYWTPETPNLYDVKLRLVAEDKVLDEVSTYFGMRKIHVRHGQILLNNKPYYQKLILDQGYWPDTLLTPPDDEAIKADILLAKEMGFNGIRKHQKIEDPRFYYWADRLGMLIWGEVPSAYDFGWDEINNIIDDSRRFIERDYNHPCIVTWVPLNESWGVRNIVSSTQQQHFASTLYHLFKAMDPTRLVNSNDGWEQISETDICGIHDYTASGEEVEFTYRDKEELLKGAAERRLIYADNHTYKGQPILVTEYGGIAFASRNEETWGYYGSVSSQEEFILRFSNITKAVQGIPYVNGYCYTQLTDVFQEANGLLTMDRQPKVDPEIIANINKNK